MHLETDVWKVQYCLQLRFTVKFLVYSIIYTNTYGWYVQFHVGPFSTFVSFISTAAFICKDIKENTFSAIHSMQKRVFSVLICSINEYMLLAYHEDDHKPSNCYKTLEETNIWPFMSLNQVVKCLNFYLNFPQFNFFWASLNVWSILYVAYLV